ncbi:MAG TPA: MFS transporter, partial [Burkholderiaceae bacterium]
MTRPDSLRAHPSYLRFWAGRLSGTMANQMLLVAVAWQMYDLTRSAWSLGLVGLFQFLPALALALVSGHVADRHDRRHIVAMSLGLQLATAVVLLAATLDGWTGRDLILGLSLVLGVARSFQMTAQQALTPLLVPESLLPRAMAFSSSGNQAAIIGGPAIGGFLYAAGARHVFETCAVLLVLAMGLAWSVRYDHRPAPREPVTMDTLLAGVRFIRARPVVLGAISLDLFAVLLGGATALLPVFAKDILLTGPWGLGLLRSAPALGALLMSFWLARFPIERNVGRIMFLAVGIFGVATIAAPALGGLLYAFGAFWVYAPTTLLYFMACALSLSLQARRQNSIQGKASLQSLMAGIHFIRSRPDIFGAISLDLFAVLLGGATALLPVFAKDI